MDSLSARSPVSSIQPAKLSNAKPIEIIPPEIIFKDIEPNYTYEITVLVRNLTKINGVDIHLNTVYEELKIARKKDERQTVEMEDQYGVLPYVGFMIGVNDYTGTILES